MAETQKMYLGDTLLNKTYLGTIGSLERYEPGVYPYADADVIAFLNATGISSRFIGDAINNLVLDMKSNGLWTKMLAIYPFVGGTATTHQFNLKNPQTTDSAFRLTFGSGITHSSNGIQLSGTGAGKTYIDVGTDVNYTNISAGVYNRTNNQENNYDIGAGRPGGFSAFLVTIRNNDAPSGYFAVKTGGYVLQYQDNTNARGFYQATRTGTLSAFLTAKNSSVSTRNDNGVSSYNGDFYVGAVGDPTTGLPWGITNRNYAYGYVGTYLNSTDLSNYYTIVQNFQTALGRQV